MTEQLRSDAVVEIGFALNGAAVTARVRAGELLLELLRAKFGLCGTKEGCGKGECGACTVLVNGRPVNACLYPAVELEDCRVTTIEGLAGPRGELSVVQQAFVDQGGIQCGFCSPGMILSAHALLERNPRPTEEQIRAALLGNLCRCTGYVQIVDSIQQAAAVLRGEAPSTGAPSAASARASDGGQSR